MKIPDSTVWNDKALIMAAREGYVDIVRRILPLSDPCTEQSKALQWASETSQEDIFHLLYPLSNAQDALASMEAREKRPKNDTRLLLERMAIDKNKEELACEAKKSWGHGQSYSRKF